MNAKQLHNRQRHHLKRWCQLVEKGTLEQRPPLGGGWHGLSRDWGRESKSYTYEKMFEILNTFSPSVSFADSLAAARPVAALTVHRTVIHYRDCASLTLVRGSLRRYCAREFIDSLNSPGKNQGSFCIHFSVPEVGAAICPPPLRSKPLAVPADCPRSFTVVACVGKKKRGVAKATPLKDVTYWLPQLGQRPALAS